MPIRNPEGVIWRVCPTLDDSPSDLVGDNDGSYSGGMTTVANTGVGGTRAFALDGSNDRIDFGDVLDVGNGDFTVTAFINVDPTATTANSAMRIVQKRGTGAVGSYRGWTFGVRRDGTDVRICNAALDGLTFTRWITDSGSGDSLGFVIGSVSTWIHLAVVVDRTNQEWRFYAGGTLVHTEPLAASSEHLDNSRELTIGGSDNSATQFFKGLIDDVNLFDSAISTDLITAIATTRGYEISLPAELPILRAGSLSDIRCGTLSNIRCGRLWGGVAPTAKINSIGFAVDESRPARTVVHNSDVINISTKYPHKLTAQGTLDSPSIVQLLINGERTNRTGRPVDLFDLTTRMARSEIPFDVTVSVHPGGDSEVATVPADVTVNEHRAAGGTLLDYAARAVNQRLSIAEAPATSKPRWLLRDHDTPTYTPNPDLWCADIDLSCCAVWNSRTDNPVFKNNRTATQIAPRAAITAQHYGLGVGVQVRFVATDGTIVQRTITKSIKHPLYGTGTPSILGPSYDLQLLIFDADITGTVPAKLLPANHTDFISRLGTCCPVACLDKVDHVFVMDVENFAFMAPDQPFFTVATSEDPIRVLFAEPIVSGDSGDPIFMFGFDAPVLLSVWTTELGSGTSIAHESDWISDTCFDETGERPEFVDLSKFPTLAELN